MERLERRMHSGVTDTVRGARGRRGNELARRNRDSPMSTIAKKKKRGRGPDGRMTDLRFTLRPLGLRRVAGRTGIDGSGMKRWCQIGSLHEIWHPQLCVEEVTCTPERLIPLRPEQWREGEGETVELVTPEVERRREGKALRLFEEDSVIVDMSIAISRLLELKF